MADGFEDGINRGWRWHSWFDVGQGLRLRAFAERRGLPAVTDLRDADAVRLKPRRVRRIARAIPRYPSRNRNRASQREAHNLANEMRFPASREDDGNA